MELTWEDGFQITVGFDGRSAVISANREGLLSLANHFLALAKEEAGSHIHLDACNSLETGSFELIVEKVE